MTLFDWYRTAIHLLELFHTVALERNRLLAWRYEVECASRRAQQHVADGAPEEHTPGCLTLFLTEASRMWEFQLLSIFRSSTIHELERNMKACHALLGTDLPLVEWCHEVIDSLERLHGVAQSYKSLLDLGYTIKSASQLIRKNGTSRRQGPDGPSDAAGARCVNARAQPSAEKKY
jgi:hypothetical protein